MASTDTQVCGWLAQAGLGRYIESFRLAGVDEPVFRKLLMQDYAKVGVEDLADKQKLFRLIKRVNSEAERGGGGGWDSPVTASPRKAAAAPKVATPISSMPLQPSNKADILDLEGMDDETDLLGEVMGSLAMTHDAAFVAESLHPGQPLCPTSPDLPWEAATREAAATAAAAHAVTAQQAHTAASESFQSHALGPAAAPPPRGGGSGSAREAAAPLAAAAAVVAEGDPPRIRVVVRKRPLNKQERGRREDDIVTMDATTGALVVHEPKTKVDMTRYIEQQKFNFDDVLDDDTDQDMVYTTTVAPLLATIFQRAKATCFAYGQTGSGKTYTMQPLPLRAVQHMLEMLRRPEHRHLHLWLSFFEIYGGKVYDLLKERKKLPVREDGGKNVVVVGLQEHEVFSLDDVTELIDLGSSTRSTGSTGANSDSSRSHAILQLVLKEAPKAKSRADEIAARHLGPQAEATEQGRLWGKFSFIDLAGSERGRDTTDNDRQTRMEGAEINKSLLALKECIRALDQEAGHVPFRGSKLTEVLRDSFSGGNCRTVMIANISPASGSCEHTLNTLRYADRVKELRRSNGPVVQASYHPAPRRAHAHAELYHSHSLPAEQFREVDVDVPHSKPMVGASRGTGSPARQRQRAGPGSDWDAPGGGGGGGSGLRRSVSTAQGRTEARAASPALASYDARAARQERERARLDREAELERQRLERERQQFEMERQQLEFERLQVEEKMRLADAAVERDGGGGAEPSSRAARTSAHEDSALHNAHTELVNTILEQSEELIATHRLQIEETMELVRKEVNLVAEMDQPGSAVDTYVQSLSEILQRKAEGLAALQTKVAQFQGYLREEEILAQTVNRD